MIAGIWVERRIECPLCGTASFLGEWMTPKETQGLPMKTCDSCCQEVDTAFLVHPREKKRGIHLQNHIAVYTVLYHLWGRVG